MAAKIDIVDDGTSTIITIKNTLNTGTLGLFIIEALSAVSGVVIFIWLFFLEDDLPLFLYLFLLGLIAVFSIVAYRYLNKITEQEIIKVDKYLLIIKLKSLLSAHENVFEVDKISLFSYHGFPKYTDHPLKGESFDYLGFQTVDRQIQTLHEDGNITFDYEGQIFQFGKRLPSWDIEKVCDAIIRATGGKLGLNLLQRQDDITSVT